MKENIHIMLSPLCLKIARSQCFRGPPENWVLPRGNEDNTGLHRVDTKLELKALCKSLIMKQNCLGIPLPFLRWISSILRWISSILTSEILNSDFLFSY